MCLCVNVRPNAWNCLGVLLLPLGGGPAIVVCHAVRAPLPGVLGPPGEPPAQEEGVRIGLKVRFGPGGVKNWSALTRGAMHSSGALRGFLGAEDRVARAQDKVRRVRGA